MANMPRLTPKQYKMLVRVSQCMWDLNSVGADSFRRKWPEVYALANRTNYERIFYNAIQQITFNNLNDHYAKAFQIVNAPKNIPNFNLY